MSSRDTSPQRSDDTATQRTEDAATLQSLRLSAEKLFHRYESILAQYPPAPAPAPVPASATNTDDEDKFPGSAGHWVGTYHKRFWKWSLAIRLLVIALPLATTDLTYAFKRDLLFQEKQPFYVYNRTNGSDDAFSNSTLSSFVLNNNGTNLSAPKVANGTAWTLVGILAENSRWRFKAVVAAQKDLARGNQARAGQIILYCSQIPVSVFLGRLKASHFQPPSDSEFEQRALLWIIRGMRTVLGISFLTVGAASTFAGVLRAEFIAPAFFFFFGWIYAVGFIAATMVMGKRLDGFKLLREFFWDLKKVKVIADTANPIRGVDIV